MVSTIVHSLRRREAGPLLGSYNRANRIDGLIWVKTLGGLVLMSNIFAGPLEVWYARLVSETLLTTIPDPKLATACKAGLMATSSQFRFTVDNELVGSSREVNSGPIESLRTAEEERAGAVCFAASDRIGGLALAQTTIQMPPTAAQVQIDLFRGLADVFSRGMDTLPDKLNKQGYSARIHSTIVCRRRKGRNHHDRRCWREDRDFSATVELNSTRSTK